MKYADRLRQIIFICIAAMLLGGCGSAYRAPVDELGGSQRFLDAGRTHRVNTGETLYAIAWMYDLDFSVLARANNLNEPYALAPGTLLEIDLRTYGSAARANTNTAPARTAAPANAGAVTVNPVQTAGTISRSQLPETTLQRTPIPEATTESPPVSTTARTPIPENPPRTVIAISPPPEPAPVIENVEPVSNASGVITWGWPAQGEIIGRFSDSGVDKKGLDIGGKRGDPVLAAADGEIVYVGSGVLRYGDLVIIKHNDRFLSAYAHNDRILVKEGARVKQGDTIANLGSSGIDSNMLHFEIRLEGTPVDPLLYLPAR